MGFAFTSAPLQRDEFSELITFFGWDEKLVQDPAIGTVLYEWSQVMAGLGNYGFTYFGRVRLYTDILINSRMGICCYVNFPIDASVVGPTKEFKKFVMEWAAGFTNSPENIDQTKFFMGMKYDINNLVTRASTDICGFGSSGGGAAKIVCVTDKSGVEQTTTTTTSINNQTHVYRMEIDNLTVKFYIDKTLVGTHTGPVQLSQMFFNIENGIGADASIYLSGIRAYFQG
jgi:hypothetical protein